MSVKTRVWFDSKKSTYRVSIRRGIWPIRWWSEVLDGSSYTTYRRSFSSFEKARIYAAHCATDVIFEHRATDYEE